MEQHKIMSKELTNRSGVKSIIKHINLEEIASNWWLQKNWFPYIKGQRANAGIMLCFYDYNEKATKYLYIVEQNKYNRNENIMNIPFGQANKNEVPLITAIREFNEETDYLFGLSVGGIEKIIANVPEPIIAFSSISGNNYSSVTFAIYVNFTKIKNGHLLLDSDKIQQIKMKNTESLGMGTRKIGDKRSCVNFNKQLVKIRGCFKPQAMTYVDWLINYYGW
jgi:hypothetical protein